MSNVAYYAFINEFFLFAQTLEWKFNKWTGKRSDSIQNLGQNFFPRTNRIETFLMLFLKYSFGGKGTSDVCYLSSSSNYDSPFFASVMCQGHRIPILSKLTQGHKTTYISLGHAVLHFLLSYPLHSFCCECTIYTQTNYQHVFPEQMQ